MSVHRRNPHRERVVSHILDEDGPYRLQLAAAIEDIGGVEGNVAVAACAPRNQQTMGYAVVYGTGRAIVGAIRATRHNRYAAVVVGLGHALTRVEDGAPVTIWLHDLLLREFLTDHRVQTRQLPYLRLHYRDRVEPVLRGLRRVQATVEDPQFTSRRPGALPDHPLFGRAYRLAWYARKIGRSQIDFDPPVLRWLEVVADRGDKIGHLRHFYDQFHRVYKASRRPQDTP